MVYRTIHACIIALSTALNVMSKVCIDTASLLVFAVVKYFGLQSSTIVYKQIIISLTKGHMMTTNCLDANCLDLISW